MMRAIVLACLAAGALAVPASAAHADRAAYVGRVNAICRSFTPKMQAAERTGKAAYAAGNAHRYAYELGIVLGLSLTQADEVQRVPVPADFARPMARPLMQLKKVAGAERTLLARALAGDEAGVLVASARLSAVGPPLNRELDAVGLRDCGSNQT
jgi:hypothetical protein